MNHMDGGGMTVVRLAVSRPAYDMLFIMVEAGVDLRKKDELNKDLLDLLSSKNEDYVLGDEQKMWFRRTVELVRSKGVMLTLRGDGE